MLPINGRAPPPRSSPRRTISNSGDRGHAGGVGGASELLLIRLFQLAAARGAGGAPPVGARPLGRDPETPSRGPAPPSAPPLAPPEAQIPGELEPPDKHE